MLEVKKGDITLMEVDAIVNAANASLLGGGGVDGAIHRAAGKGLLLECMTLHGCATGEAKITKGYHLPARYVIHTVGPVYYGLSRNKDALLASCYRNSIQLAIKHQLKSIAFPAISTGIYGYPKKRAATIAVQTVNECLKSAGYELNVTFVCFDQETYDIYVGLVNQDTILHEEYHESSNES